MKGRDRNKPCFCGSGKKFKKCHYLRDGGYNIVEGPAMERFIKDSVPVYNYGQTEKYMSGMPKVRPPVGA